MERPTHPGAAEWHQQRSTAILRFPLYRQMATAHEVCEARLAHTRPLHEISIKLGELSHPFAQTTELPLSWQSFLDGDRDYIDRLDERRLAAGGQKAPLGDAIARLRADILTTWGTSLIGLPRCARKKRKGPSDARFCTDATGPHSL